jgi:hypothetical protein
MTTARFGQALARLEDHRLLTGRGCYVDDISLPGMVHGFIVYSNAQPCPLSGQADIELASAERPSLTPSRP